MKTLIVGNSGYVGPVLAKEIKAADSRHVVAGFDTAYFTHNLTGPDYPERILDAQYFGDVRQFPAALLKGVDAVVYLAAISNDPMGKLFASQTRDINQYAAINIASAAKQAGIKHFVFASSCSVYGSAGDYPRKEDSELNPLTAYAKSKINTEEVLAELATRDFIITCPRFATACGFSPRLRLDLVLNDFTASATTSGVIEILSDGTPWRPLIHVKDMARILIWASQREADNGGNCLVVNAGAQHWNYQVLELAQAVQRQFPHVEISVNKNAAPDKRSYQVDFSRLKSLAGDSYPRVSLDDAIKDLKDGLSGLKFADKNFRRSGMIRLHVLQGHVAARRLTKELYWK